MFKKSFEFQKICPNKQYLKISFALSMFKIKNAWALIKKFEVGIDYLRCNRALIRKICERF